MKLFTDLITIIRPNKMRYLHTLGKRNDQTDELFSLIQGGFIQNDRDAKEYFFKDNPHANRYLWRLKNTLWHRIINSVLIIDWTVKDGEYFKRYKDCYLEYAAYKVLAGLGFRKASISIAESALQKAIECNLTTTTIELSKDLRRHYGMSLGNVVKYNHFDKIVRKWVNILEKEEIADSYFSEIALHFGRKKMPKVRLNEKIESYAKELRSLLGEVNSYKFNYYTYYVLLLNSAANNDHAETIIICKEALSFFEDKIFKTRGTTCTFTFQIAISYIQLQQYEEARKYLDKVEGVAVFATPNWAMLQQYSFIIALHCQDYNQAFQINKWVKKQRKKLLAHTVEQWDIYDALIGFLVSIGKVDIKSKSKFRLNRFLNSVPTYSKDKRGNNITILMIQVLFLLQQRNYDKIIDKTESLSSYCSRYLKQDANFRSNCFFKILLQLEKSSFNHSKFKKKTQDLFERLKSQPINISNQDADIEIIPYETLYNFIVEILASEQPIKPRTKATKKVYHQ